MERPAYFVSCQKPGSDVAGETAAALASASILFKEDSDATYSNNLLRHAKEIFDFADSCRGKYSDVIHDASIFYK